ncbi:F0F1 ATP synthase subunit B [Nostocoides australiense]|uniref:ATP synthase subunit b n=1 Tax=Nostocoides australiense Ben110 TaxID=1193182 RepID=W6K237_9MICO|nr:ATP synthase subunit b [Tetrasphaera australiensis Ben110]
MHLTGLAPLVTFVAETEGTAGGDPVAGRTPILPLWGELIFGIIAFAILYWVVAKKVVPNLEKAYAARAAAIEGGMAQAEEAQAAADAAKAQYEAQLKDARTEASKIREDARVQGTQIVNEMRGQAQAEATRITDAAHRQIEAERSQAAASLRGEVGRLSTDLASKIVGESLHDEARQKGIVDRFLAELESGDLKPQKVES